MLDKDSQESACNTRRHNAMGYDLSTGTFTFEAKGYVGGNIVSTDTCTATKPSYTFTSAENETIYGTDPDTLVTYLYVHSLQEEYYLITYNVPYSGKTAVVRTAISGLGVTAAHWNLILYLDEHRYLGESGNLTNWKVMTLDTNSIGNPYTYYKNVTAGAEGAGLYVFPEQLTGISKVSSVLLDDLGGGKVLGILNGKTDRNIP